jgi:hypothetical protein
VLLLARFNQISTIGPFVASFILLYLVAGYHVVVLRVMAPGNMVSGCQRLGGNAASIFTFTPK